MNNLNTIVNVYQFGTFGLGDYIRGCYCLLGICDKYNLSFGACINHPINKFLKYDFNFVNRKNLEKTIILDILYASFYADSNGEISVINIHSEELVSTLMNLPRFNDTIYVQNNSFPFCLSPTSHKEFMRKILEPTDEMSMKVDSTLNIFKFQPKQFITIHIRIGDDVLVDNNISNIKNYCLLNLLSKINNIPEVRNANEQIVLISDSNFIKRHVLNKFRNFKTIFHSILHFGLHKNQLDDDIQNNMIDFYLLSKSAKIYSFTVYGHGSGFSQWCAFTYDIPYSCKLISKEKESYQRRSKQFSKLKFV
jgi:hypothetical protein